ncbi:MAG: polyphosphate:AMP phosphotransferase [Lentisphaeria bacterium]|nr:polyphosphate:AMP phosphotransferase [Lentisphaeria bacterium]
MFDNLENQEDIGKAEFKARVLAIRTELILTQQRLRNSEKSFPVIFVFAGVDGAGKHETVDVLNDWMDARWMETHAYTKPTEEERMRPEFWRYWRDIPQNGEISLCLSAWYSRPLLNYVKKGHSKGTFKRDIVEINEFEKTLKANRTLILKFWMHLDKKKQLDRLEYLSKNALTSWQVKSDDWENVGLYEDFIKGSIKLIEKCDEVPWTIINGANENSRQLEVAETFIKQVNKQLDIYENAEKPQKVAIAPFGSGHDRLGELDLKQSLKGKLYDEKLAELQADLFSLSQKAHRKQRSIILVFEGADAAGKGGCIKRISRALDARQYDVQSIAAPTKEELAHHYLWRFWNEIPLDGRIKIFDRSWYGRLLVERIEGFATDVEWQQAFDEINDFEGDLQAHGCIILKFWLQVGKDEQYNRFKERETIPYKKWKLTDEDWRNRDRWDDYQIVINDVLDLCHTKVHPWHPIASNCKKYARIEVLETLVNRLKNDL